MMTTTTDSGYIYCVCVCVCCNCYVEIVIFVLPAKFITLVKLNENVIYRIYRQPASL